VRFPVEGGAQPELNLALLRRQGSRQAGIMFSCKGRSPDRLRSGAFLSNSRRADFR